MLENASPGLLMTLSGVNFREYLESCETFERFLKGRYQEVRLDLVAQEYFITYPDTLNWVMIVEEENPDVLLILPIVQRIIECSHRFNLYLFQVEDEVPFLDTLIEEADIPEDLVDMEAPVLLLFDEEWTYQSYWGPRAAAVDPLLEEWLETHPEYEELATNDYQDDQDSYIALLTELIGTMRIWYNSGLDKRCVEEFHALLVTIQEQSQSDVSYDAEDISDRAE